MKIYVTAHRGMGVTAKNRSTFVKDAKFYPENSIEAFKQGIEAGADALECDIHVSKDNVAIVIHGNILLDYAYYIGKTEDMQFNGDSKYRSNLLCDKLNKDEIETNFVLKTFEKDLIKEEKINVLNYYVDNLTKSPDRYKIPTLAQLFALVALENKNRLETKQLPLILNIELKGKHSGFVTLATLIQFNKKATQNKTPIMDPAYIVLLGKMEIAEIVIAKNLLKNANIFGNVEKKGNVKSEREQLEKLFGTHELEYQFHRETWDLFIIDELSKEKLTSLTNLPDIDKAIVLTNKNEAFFCKKNKDKLNFITADNKILIIDKFFNVKDKILVFKGDKEFSEVCGLLKTTNIADRMDLNPIKNSHEILHFGKYKLIFEKDKKCLEAYELLKKANFELIRNNNELIFKDNEKCLEAYKVLESKKEILDFKKSEDNEKIIKHALTPEANAIIANIIFKSDLPNYGSADVSNIPQEYTTGKIKDYITKYLSTNMQYNLQMFLAEVQNLAQIRTNIMLSSGELYGANCLIDNEDFDINPKVKNISKFGYNMIVNCFLQGYDGFDISLFDFDEQSITAINKSTTFLNSTNTPIIGVTASNWKGVISEKSPISPATAIDRAIKIAKKINLDLLVKVDEPGLFKMLYNILSDESKEKEKEIIFLKTENFIESEKFTIIKEDIIESPSSNLSKWLNSNYDFRTPDNNEFITPLLKPPRNEVKKPLQILQLKEIKNEIELNISKEQQKNFGDRLDNVTKQLDEPKVEQQNINKAILTEFSIVEKEKINLKVKDEEEKSTVVERAKKESPSPGKDL